MLEQKGRRNTKPVNLVSSRSDNSGTSVGAVELADFAPFVMDGYVSLPGDSCEVPIKILRDTAVSQSFILAGVLPLGPGLAVGSNVPVLCFGMEDLDVPLHRVCIRSELLN